MQRACPCAQCEHVVVSARMALYHGEQIRAGTRLLAPPPADEDDAESSPSEASLSDDYQHELDQEGEEEEIRVPQVLDGFCMDMVDLIARNQVGVTGMDNVLKILTKHIRMHLDPEIQDLLPHSMYALRCQAEEIAGAAAGCRTFYRHFCYDCGEIFPVNPTACACSTDGCAGTRYTKQGNPRSKALYYDIRDKLTKLARSGFLRTFLQTPIPPAHDTEAARHDLHDVYDGDIINDLRKLWPALHVLYVAMVCTRTCSCTTHTF
jgi:hypothetical protein